MKNEELVVAGIQFVQNERTEYGEVAGKLGGWNFHNKNECWLANTPGFSKRLPGMTARQFEKAWPREAGMLSINGWDNDETACTIQLYTQAALTAFAHLIKAFAKAECLTCP